MDDNFFNRNVDLDPWDYNSEKNNNHSVQNQYYNSSRYNGNSKRINKFRAYKIDADCDTEEFMSERERIMREEYEQLPNLSETDIRLMKKSVAFSVVSFLLLFLLMFFRMLFSAYLNIILLSLVLVGLVLAVIGVITAIKVLKKGYAKESSMAIMSIIFALMSFSVFGYHMLIFLFGILF